MVVDGQGFETAIASDAVVDVNHRRTDVEFDQVLDDQIRIDATALGAFHGGFGAMPEDVRFGNDSVFRQPIAALDGRDGYGQLALALLEGCEVLDIGGAQPFALQELLQMRLAAQRLGGKQHPRRGVGHELTQAGGGILSARIDREIRQRLAAETNAMAMDGAVRV